jgi:hypothetical protein
MKVYLRNLIPFDLKIANNNILLINNGESTILTYIKVKRMFICIRLTEYHLNKERA